MQSTQVNSDNPYRPSDIDIEWDAVVVGTGMGGSTLGYSLAKNGYRVLFLEKGPFLLSEATRGDRQGNRLRGDETVAERIQKGQWPLRLQGEVLQGEANFFAPLGCGTGGSTNLYASQLERFHPSDFESSIDGEGVADGTRPSSWPIEYGEMLPYYRAAERLYGVAGTEDPLQPDSESVLVPPRPLSPRDQDLFDSFGELGLHPYRAHCGGFKNHFACDECAGILCPTGCKSDAGTTALRPALQRFGAKLLDSCEVREFEANDVRVNAVLCLVDQQTVRIRAKRFFLAAGALMTPLIMLRSTSNHWPTGLANRSDAVGRNLMLHVSDFIIVRPRRPLATDGPRKSIALSDFYTSKSSKLGLLQSVGIEVDFGYVLYFLRRRIEEDPRWWHRLARPFLPLAALIGYLHYRKSAVFATIIEDFPYWDNRVVASPDSNDGRKFVYHYRQELKRRVSEMRDLIRMRLHSRHRVRIPSGFNNLNFGHACGTCRFGSDPATSVLDKNNKAHDLQNFYVVDASFFPSSSGTNPSLTIAANALRVADAVLSEDACSVVPHESASK